MREHSQEWYSGWLYKVQSVIAGRPISTKKIIQPMKVGKTLTPNKLPIYYAPYEPNLRNEIL